MTDIKQRKKEAAEFLGRKGRRIEIIFFGLLLVFVTIAPIYLFAYLEYFFYEIADHAIKTMALGVYKGAIEISCSIVAGACAILLAIFLTFPIYACFFGSTYRIYRDGIAGRRKYFALGERGYFGAMGSGAVICGVLAICLAPVIALVQLGEHLAKSDDERVVTLVTYLFFLIVAVGLVLGFLIFLLFRPLFLFAYYSARGEKMTQALSKSVKRMRSPRAKQTYKEYIMAFLPSLLLSLATVLVLFLLDTLPKMTMVYFDIADEMAQGE